MKWILASAALGALVLVVALAALAENDEGLAEGTAGRERGSSAEENTRVVAPIDDGRLPRNSAPAEPAATPEPESTSMAQAPDSPKQVKVYFRDPSVLWQYDLLEPQIKDTIDLRRAAASARQGLSIAIAATLEFEGRLGEQVTEKPVSQMPRSSDERVFNLNGYTVRFDIDRFPEYDRVIEIAAHNGDARHSDDQLQRLPDDVRAQVLDRMAYARAIIGE